ncbi:hypothetical protein ABPG75_008641 [Micractinium tetrahymenae]
MAAAAAPLAGLGAWGLQFLAVWLLGLVLGWLLPKPRWVDRSLRAKALLLSTPPGLWARRLAVLAHLSIIIREVWRNLFAPGTFRGVLRNAWRTLTTGARFEWPTPAATGATTDAAAIQAAAAPAAADSWYITAKDLAHFKWTIDEDGGPAGASAWEPMMQKQWPGCTYTAWRRTLPSGKSEYKSVTVSEDATAEEFMDFYLDDETRMKWDSMITETQLLETASDPAARCQVVRWLRTFPFAFISQREYVIARRFFREGDGLYAVTRGLVEHPAAPRVPGQVRMESFHSCWRSRTVPCPHGSGRPAVETTLLHFEDFRINERLARFAVRAGMAGFVKGMIPAVQRFVADRRERCSPTAEDPASFGHRVLAPAPTAARLEAPPAAPGSPAAASGLPRSASLASSTSGSASASYSDLGAAAGCARTASDASLACDSASLAGSDRSVRSEGAGMARTSSMRRLGAMMLASGVAIALARTASTGSLPPASPGSGGHSHAHGKRYGPAGGGSGRHHGQRRHAGQGGSHGHAARGGAGEAPPRPRRRQQPVPVDA